MSDSIIALISQNLVTTLDGKKLSRDLVRTITCEEQRLQTMRIEYPYIAVVGPSVQVKSRANKSAHCSLDYNLYLVDNEINDEQRRNANPVAYQMRNDVSDIIKFLMVDITRGGYAVRTHWNSYDPMINPEGPEYIIALDIEIECFVNEFDPYLLG